MLIVDCRSPWTCHHSLAVVFDRIPKDSKQSEICHEIHHTEELLSGSVAMALAAATAIEWDDGAGPWP